MKQLLILFITLLSLQSCTKKSINGELIFAEANPSEGFNFPYFLFIPQGTSVEKELILIVEPNNSGFADDDFERHIEKAKRTASHDFYIGNFVARELKIPLLVPVFPRPKSEWKIYTHALDSDVIAQKDNSLERIDLQLLAMVTDAKTKLADSGYSVRDKFFMTGFSASGTFANRFTIIHPEKIQAVAAGGLNGLLMLPIGKWKGENLNYPIGTNDLKALTNKSFTKDLFNKTPQFYFMGKLDENDAVPYSDAFGQVEREQIYRLLGEQMQPERWNNCTQIYRNLNVNGTFLSYEDVGHEHPESIKNEIIKFFREVIKKGNVQKWN